MIYGTNSSGWEWGWNKILLRYYVICQIIEKKLEYNKAVHHLFTDFKKAYDSVRRKVLYNILIKFGIPMKLVRLIKMCLNETYSRVWVGKNMSGMFPIRNGMIQGATASVV